MDVKIERYIENVKEGAKRDIVITYKKEGDRIPLGIQILDTDDVVRTYPLSWFGIDTERDIKKENRE